MNKIITIIMILMMVMGQAGGKKEDKKPVRGIGEAAYHEQVCGIGDAAEHVPGGIGE